MFLGPDLPPIRVSSGCEAEPSRDVAQSLYRSLLWDRRVRSMGMTLKGVWLFAALPEDVPTVTWVYECNQGLSVVHSDRTGTQLRDHPLMERTLLVPCITFGEVGVANHTFDTRPMPVLQRRALRSDGSVIDADEPCGVSLLQHSAALLRSPKAQADSSIRPPSPPPVADVAPSVAPGAAPDAATQAAFMPATSACPAVLRAIATPSRRRATHAQAVSGASGPAYLADPSTVLRPQSLVGVPYQGYSLHPAHESAVAAQAQCLAYTVPCSS